MNARPHVAAIVLAAGASRRLGRPKQLVPVRGRALVRTVALAARSSSCTEVAVVVGACADEVRSALDGLDLEIVDNPRWPEGVASSIRAGIGWAVERGCEAAVLMVCDQPLLTAAHLDRLVEAWSREEGTGFAASGYGGVLGVPAVFGRCAFDALLALCGDQGARSVLRAASHVAVVDWPEGILDLDTPEDLQRCVSAIECSSRRPGPPQAG